MIRIRPGEPRDTAALVHLINLAYEAERFFVLGDRTDEAEVRREVEAGAFLVAADGDDAPVACVAVERTAPRAGFGMLAVDPARQGQGLGRRLIDAAEAEAAAAGATDMEIAVVNLRGDLLALYGRLGYAPAGTKPYVHRPTIQPCHFILMRKTIAPAGPTNNPITPITQ